MKKIPLHGIDRFYHNNRSEILELIDINYSGGRVLMGEEVKVLESRLASISKRKYALTVGSCTDALFLSLMSAGIKKGDEVLVSCFSFIASVTPILRLGATPVFIDIDPETFMMDFSDLRNKISSKSKAIVAVHLFGQSLEIEPLDRIAKSNNLIVIEDSAQSIGCHHKNRVSGKSGLTSCYSFDPTKIIGAFGTGGALVTDDFQLYNKVNTLRYQGKNHITGHFEHIGYNSHISSSQAAIIFLQLNQLESIIKRRNDIADLFKKNLNHLKEVICPITAAENDHTYSKFVIKCDKRNQLQKYLAENGIETKIHYNRLLFENKLFESYPHVADNIKIAMEIKDKVLSLPIYPELENEDISYICDKISSFYK